MNFYLFITLLFALQGLYWFVGRRSSKTMEGQNDYFLAGKKVGFFPLMMTFLATQVGGGVALGSADEAYRFGWPIFLYPAGVALGLIVLGSGIGRRLASFQVSTVAEILEVTYRSSKLKKIASGLSIISLFMILAAQIIASHKFLTSLGLTNDLLFIAFWSVVILYTVQGGLRAVISTDMMQAGVFSIIFVLCFAVAASSGASNIMQWPEVQSFAAVSSQMSGWLLMPLLFMVIEQDMGQRCFAGNSPRTVSLAALWAGIIAMGIGLVPIFFGVLAKSLGLVIPEKSSVLMFTIEKTLNPWIAACAGCAILAAIISTATSLINAISCNVSNDFKRKTSSIRSVRMITAAISIAGIAFAFYFNDIVGLLIQSYELSVSCLAVPILAALFKKRGNPLSAYLAIALGAGGFCLFRIWSLELPREIASIVLSLAGYGSGEAIAYLQSRELKGSA